ncbi:nicotinate (nicotinamide) nucleotide adenylyltransferase [soil metagenome]
MRYAVFGGSFDPPHLAHAMACLWALESGEVDRVLLVPVGRHAFGKKNVASFEHRVQMCHLAVARLRDAVFVSDIESRREGASYMVDTLRLLADEHPGAQFRLLAGTDVVEEFPKWKDLAEVLRRAPLLELPRAAPNELFADRPGALPLISSTAVRDALRTGRDAELLVAKSVREYIEAHKLYR